MLSSCTHKYYAPNTHSVPLFQQAGEAHAAGILWTGSEVSGAEVQGAYALTNRIGVMANLITGRGGHEVKSGRGYLLEAGSGYYKSVGGKGVVEAYAGVGAGRVKNHYYTGQSSMVSLFRLFVQPSIGYTTPYFDCAFSARLAWLSLLNPRGGVQGVPNSSEIYYWEYVRQHPRSLLLEPALTIRGGWKYCKLQLQLGLSGNLSHSAFPQEDVNLSLGLYMSLADKYKQRR
jgi:hypothetical protein